MHRFKSSGLFGGAKGEQMNAEALISELQTTRDRITIYGDALEPLRFIDDLVEDLEHLECDGDHYDLHEECFSSEQVEDMIHEETRDLKTKLEKVTKRRKGYTDEKHALLDRIEDLETKLSDAKADIAVYRDRHAKGPAIAQLAEDFEAFTPEEVRATWKIISGGAA